MIRGARQILLDTIHKKTLSMMRNQKDLVFRHLVLLVVLLELYHKLNHLELGNMAQFQKTLIYQMLKIHNNLLLEKWDYREKICQIRRRVMKVAVSRATQYLIFRDKKQKVLEKVGQEKDQLLFKMSLKMKLIMPMKK
jgi:hypothetical protein